MWKRSKCGVLSSKLDTDIITLTLKVQRPLQNTSGRNGTKQNSVFCIHELAAVVVACIRSPPGEASKCSIMEWKACTPN